MTKINIIIYLAFSIVMFCKCKAQNNGYEEQAKRDTLSKHIYGIYLLQFNDSIKSIIQHEKYSSLNNNEMPFSSNSFNHKTEIIIDTILFSPEYKKIAFFAITKNVNYKLLINKSTDEFQFDAYCFIANVNSIVDTWNIKWFHPLNYIHFSSLNEVSKLIRQGYFKELTKIYNDKYYKYNLNDIRFWIDDKVWNPEFKSNFFRYYSP